MKTYCIVLASGEGSRFGADRPKQFVEVGGHQIIEYTLDACARTQEIDELILVVSKSWVEPSEALCERMKFGKPVRVVVGGASRQESCMLGLAAIDDEEAKVLIHNGVQPFVTPQTLAECVAALDKYNAVSVGSPSVYTVLELNEKRELRHIVDRRCSVNDLGPECFKLRFLRKVFDIVGDEAGYTNFTGMVYKYDLDKVYVVDGNPSNVKITYPDDLLFAGKKFADYKFAGDDRS